MKRSPSNPFLFVYSFLFLFLAFLYSLTVGFFELPDGYFYIVLGKFLYTGVLLPVIPFNRYIPQTLFGPVYGLITYPLMSLPSPWGMTILPFFQLTLVLLSSFMLYGIGKMLWNKRWATVVMVLFVFLPFLLVYATSLMSESVMTFLVTTYLYLFVRILKRKPNTPPSLLVFIGCIAALTKNVYIFLLGISILIWIYSILQSIRKNIRSKYEIWSKGKLLFHVPAFIGLLFIALWSNFNHTYHGTWMLTNYTGRHLYNNVVHSARLLPPPDSEVWKAFYRHIPNMDEILKPEYYAETYYRDEFLAGKITELGIDQVFMNVSLSAIKAHPTEYIQNVFRTMLGDATSPPYHDTILSHLGYQETDCPECNTDPCHISWNRNFCTPAVPNSVATNIWANFILINKQYYPLGAFAALLFSLIGIITGLIQKNKIIIFISGIFVFLWGSQSAMQQIEGRYLLPLYPLYAILIVTGIQEVFQVLQSQIRLRRSTL